VSDLALFLDRDGVLNEMILNPKTQEFESPHHPDDLKIFDNVFEPLKEAQKKYNLFVISNQPSYAKGKTSLENIKAIGEKFSKTMIENGVRISEYYYCYHHPQGIVEDYSYECSCRKPKPGFLLQAAEDYKLSLRQSWMVGDRDTDVECGQNAGTLTALVLNEHSAKHQGRSTPNLKVNNLAEAIEEILNRRKS